jgi:hypothetical protein
MSNQFYDYYLTKGFCVQKYAECLSRFVAPWVIVVEMMGGMRESGMSPSCGTGGCDFRRDLVCKGTFEV